MNICTGYLRTNEKGEIDISNAKKKAIPEKGKDLINPVEIKTFSGECTIDDNHKITGVKPAKETVEKKPTKTTKATKSTGTKTKSEKETKQPKVTGNAR